MSNEDFSDSLNFEKILERFGQLNITTLNEEVAKKIYRKEAMRFHPDKHIGNKEAQDAAEEEFKKLGEQYALFNMLFNTTLSKSEGDYLSKALLKTPFDTLQALLKDERIESNPTIKDIIEDASMEINHREYQNYVLEVIDNWTKLPNRDDIKDFLSMFPVEDLMKFIEATDNQTSKNAIGNIIRSSQNPNIEFKANAEFKSEITEILNSFESNISIQKIADRLFDLLNKRPFYLDTADEEHIHKAMNKFAVLLWNLPDTEFDNISQWLTTDSKSASYTDSLQAFMHEYEQRFNADLQTQYPSASADVINVLKERDWNLLSNEWKNQLILFLKNDLKKTSLLYQNPLFMEKNRQFITENAQKIFGNPVPSEPKETVKGNDSLKDDSKEKLIKILTGDLQNTFKQYPYLSEINKQFITVNAQRIFLDCEITEQNKHVILEIAHNILKDPQLFEKNRLLIEKLYDSPLLTQKNGAFIKLDSLILTHNDNKFISENTQKISGDPAYSDPEKTHIVKGPQKITENPVAPEQNKTVLAGILQKTLKTSIFLLEKLIKHSVDIANSSIKTLRGERQKPKNTNQMYNQNVSPESGMHLSPVVHNAPHPQAVNMLERLGVKPNHPATGLVPEENKIHSKPLPDIPKTPVRTVPIALKTSDDGSSHSFGSTPKNGAR